MSKENKVTKEQIESLEAFKLKTFGDAKSGYVKLDDNVPVTICFTDWSKKNEQGEYVNMWEEQAEGDNGTYNVAVFRVLDMTDEEKQEEKTLSVSSKRLFNKIQRLLLRGYMILEITKHKGQTQYDTDYDVIPVGGSG